MTVWEVAAGSVEIEAEEGGLKTRPRSGPNPAEAYHRFWAFTISPCFWQSRRGLALRPPAAFPSRHAAGVIRFLYSLAVIPRFCYSYLGPPGSGASGLAAWLRQ